LKEYICKIYLKKIIELQKCHEDERYELRDELKRHETFDLNIIKRQIIDINRLYAEREDFALRMYKIIFKNSTTNRSQHQLYSHKYQLQESRENL